MSGLIIHTSLNCESRIFKKQYVRVSWERQALETNKSWDMPKTKKIKF